MDLFALFERRVAAALERLEGTGRIPAGLDASRVLVEPPRDASHGDLATNAALTLAKEARMNPRALADLLVADLCDDPRVQKAEVAGPGFINLTLVPAVYHEVVRAIVADCSGFGRAGE
jgi:arginyl-tRNA synthetase